MNNQNALINTQDQPIIFYLDRKKILLLLTASFTFVVAGIWLASSDNLEHKIAGILCIAFFGLCGLVSLGCLVRPIPILIMNEKGIQQFSLSGNVFVAWEEVALIFSGTGNSSYFNIYLSESGKGTYSARYPRRWQFSQRFGDLPVITLSPLLLPIPAQQIEEILAENYRQQIEANHITIS